MDYYKIRCWLVLGIALTFTAGFARAAPPAKPKGPPIGTLAFVQGQILVNAKEAKDGQDLFEGDNIETQKGKGTVLLGRESVFHLDQNSKLQIGKYLLNKRTKSEEAKINLDFGRTKALIKSKTTLRKDFEVHARGAVMGVRGTAIFVESPKDVALPPSFATLAGQADLYIPVKKEDTGRVQLKDLNKPAFKKVEMKTNQLVKTTGGDKGFEVVDITPEQLAELANSVSAPQELPKTQSEMKDYIGSDGGSFVPKDVFADLDTPEITDEPEEIQLPETTDDIADQSPPTTKHLNVTLTLDRQRIPTSVLTNRLKKNGRSR